MNLTKLGIDRLNPMQEAMAACPARRIMLLAPTGSGKTVAFTLAMLRRIKPRRGAVTALVVVPSRELAIQVAGVIRQGADDLRVVDVYGGRNYTDEANSLAVVPDIVVGTPGRVLDHMRRGRLDIGAVDAVVLDEFDKSLELGFRDEMAQIMGVAGQPDSIILTSATKAPEIPDFVDMEGCATIDYTTADLQAGAPAPQLRVLRVESPVRDKLDTLVELLRSVPDGLTIVFVNHREAAERVFDRLRSLKMPAVLYHGGLDQMQRQRAIITFTNGSTPILVSTDLGARGLDIDGVRTVIHYHLPASPEAFTHRNGRTGRQGTSGDAYVILSEADPRESFIEYDDVFTPGGKSDRPLRAHYGTIYFDAGRREKLSRGDILGFLIAQGGLRPDDIGRIDVTDHAAYAAVRRDRLAQTLDNTFGKKIKNRKVRLSRLKD